jgi:FkbM family methyltransferase
MNLKSYPRIKPCFSKDLEFYSRYSPDVDRYLIKEIFENEIYRFDCGHDYPVIIDCGANIGLSLLYFKILYPRSRIISFEPDAVSFRVADKNISFHNFDNISLIKKAASHVNDIADFYVFPVSDKEIPVCSLYPNALANKRISVESVDVSGLPDLDEGVDFMKIDIEGGESDVVYSLSSSGKIRNVREFVVEYHRWVKQRYSLSEFVAVFEEHGFCTELVCDEDIHPAYPDTSGNTVLKFTRKD